MRDPCKLGTEVAPDFLGEKFNPFREVVMNRGMLVIGMMFPLALLAQEPSNTSSRQEIDQEINNMYPDFKVKVRSASSKKRPVVVAQNDKAIPDINSIDDSSVKGNSGKSSATADVKINVEQQAQAQPLAIIEDTPTKESKADLLRKRRSAVETETEEQIVERLERDRMTSEQKRAKKIVGGLKADEDTAAIVESVETQPTPVQVYQPAQIQTVVQPTAQPVERVQSPISREEYPVEKELVREENPGKTQGFVGAVGGLGSYPTANAIKGNFAGGFQAGVYFAD